MQISEDKGFDVNEMEVALLNVAATSDIIQWLEMRWPVLQSTLVERYEAKFNEKISETEAREVLVKYPTNFEEALEQCKITREQKVL